MGMYDSRGGTRIIPDPVLTRISVGWSVANQMVGDVLFPRVGTEGEQSGQYYFFGRESWQINHTGNLRAPGARTNEVEGAEVASDNFFAHERALKQFVTQEEQDLYRATPLQPFREATENVTSKIILGRELEISELVRNPATYIDFHVLDLAADSGARQFQNHDDASDPIALARQVFRRFHKTLFTVPNLAIIPFSVMTWLEDHPSIVGRYVAQGGVMTAEMIASLLGVQRVIVPGGAYNSSPNPARTEEISYIWGNDIIFAWVPPRPGRKVPAFGYEFVWDINGQTMSTDTWRDTDRVGDYTRVRRRYDLKIVGKEGPEPTDKAISGFLVKNAISEDAAEPE